jgi:hypothetical protein
MDILLETILVGLAVGFAIAFINSTLGDYLWWLSPRVVRLSLTIPFSFGSAWLLGISWPSIVVVTLAAGFISNGLLLLLDRASIVSIKR